MNQKEFQDQYLTTFEQPKQSDLLTQFYRAYAGWLEAGAPERIIFSRSHGLCTNLVNWARATDLDLYDRLRVNMEMRQQFRAARRDESYPFDGHPESYTQTVMEDRCYLNEHRIKWVREHAEL